MKTTRTLHCCSCGGNVPARLTSGAEIYPHRIDLPMTTKEKVTADINAAGEGWVQVTLSGVNVGSLTEQQIADAIAQMETMSPPAAISSDKFTREELAQLFPDGIPMIFVKLIFPDLSSALTAGELRQIARALTSPTQAENEARIRAAITPAPDLSAENDIIQEAHEETIYQRFNDLFKRGRAAGGFASETQNLIRELANAMCDAANWRANTKIALKIEQKMRMDIAAENERLRKNLSPILHLIRQLAEDTNERNWADKRLYIKQQAERAIGEITKEIAP